MRTACVKGRGYFSSRASFLCSWLRFCVPDYFSLFLITFLCSWLRFSVSDNVSMFLITFLCSWLRFCVRDYVSVFLITFLCSWLRFCVPDYVSVFLITFLCSWLRFVAPSLSTVLRVAVQLRLSHGEIMRQPITRFGASLSARRVPKTRKWVQLAYCCQVGSLRVACLHDVFVYKD